jgi:D-alanyl-D-alanine carboxypeptidase
MIIKNRNFFNFLFIIWVFFLNQNIILNSKENDKALKIQNSNKIKIQTKIKQKSNQNFSKSTNLNQKNIVRKTLLTGVHSPKNLKNPREVIKTNDNRIKSFYLNGKKFFYKDEYSPSNYKLNNFCFLAIDGRSGDVLFAKNPNEKCYPASLTKLMTLYILFENLAKKNLKMNSRIYFSKLACAKQKKNLNLTPGDSISVFEAIQAMIVISANDVAAAFAEKISGSEENFSKLMTLKAKELGMNSTKFGNASGLFHPIQQTTAIDLLRLSIAIKRDFPQYYHFFSQTNFSFRGKTLSTHNRVTRNYPGANGFKTGFTHASGFNIVSSATRNGRDVLAVVIGADTAPRRDAYMMNLLDQSFSKLNSLNFLKKNRYNEYFKNYKSKKSFEKDFIEDFNGEEFSNHPQLVSFSHRGHKRQSFDS